MKSLGLKKIDIKKVKIHSEFKEFLKEYKVVPLAIAFVMGVAATALIQSVVNNLIMPLITPFIPGRLANSNLEARTDCGWLGRFSWCVN